MNVCESNRTSLSRDLGPDPSEGWPFPNHTAPAEEEGSFVHPSLSLESTAHLKMKFWAKKGPQKSIKPQTSFYRWGNWVQKHDFFQHHLSVHL